MVVAASKKDETVTTPLKKSLFRNYHPLFLLFYSGITCHRYGKTGQPPQKVSTHCMEHSVCIFWRKKCNLIKTSCFLYGYSKGSQGKFGPILICQLSLSSVFLNCNFFPHFLAQCGRAKWWRLMIIGEVCCSIIKDMEDSVFIISLRSCLTTYSSRLLYK